VIIRDWQWHCVPHILIILHFSECNWILNRWLAVSCLCDLQAGHNILLLLVEMVTLQLQYTYCNVWHITRHSPSLVSGSFCVPSFSSPRIILRHFRYDIWPWNDSSSLAGMYAGCLLILTSIFRCTRRSPLRIFISRHCLLGFTPLASEVACPLPHWLPEKFTSARSSVLGQPAVP
jgi:hypothetical protein